MSGNGAKKSLMGIWGKGEKQCNEGTKREKEFSFAYVT